MVKRRVKTKRRNVLNRRISKRNNPKVPADHKKAIERVHRKFVTYEEKIDRLRELEREVRVLDPMGFSTEIKIIRSKLKDPTAIPEIERHIAKLRKKMLTD